MEKEKKFSYSFNDDINEIARLEDIVHAMGKEWAIDEKLQFSINLVLEELISNIIFYGFKRKDSNNIINLVALINKDEIVITLSDNAIEFNILEQEEKAISSKSVDDMEVGGLGIHFIKNLTSFIKYNRKNGFNYLTLSFILKS
jgi:anti-sigma regulatory factor (Ser/Thr protein kinase)